MVGVRQRRFLLSRRLFGLYSPTDNRDRRRRACYIPSVPLEGGRELKKSDVVSHVVNSASLPKAESVAAVDAVFEAIQDCLVKGEPVVITGFGTFSTTSRRARGGRNPRTGESIDIAASTAPSFKAGKTLRDAVR